MKPLSFEHETAREVTGDSVSRTIEAKARTDADALIFDPPRFDGDTYWGRVQAQMQFVVYCEQHTKRKARNERKKTPSVRGEPWHPAQEQR